MIVDAACQIVTDEAIPGQDPQQARRRLTGCYNVTMRHWSV